MLVSLFPRQGPCFPEPHPGSRLTGPESTWQRQDRWEAFGVSFTSESGQPCDTPRRRGREPLRAHPGSLNGTLCCTEAFFSVASLLSKQGQDGARCGVDGTIPTTSPAARGREPASHCSVCGSINQFITYQSSSHLFPTTLLPPMSLCSVPCPNSPPCVHFCPP